MLSYSCFILDKTVFNINFNDCEWVYFVLGFSVAGDGYLLQVNFVYLIIFMMLAVERNFIDNLKFKELVDPTPKNPKFSIVCKILIESFLPSIVMGIGIYKLTVFSIVYSFAGIFTVRLHPLLRTRALFYVLLLASITQYAVLLINLSNYDSPYTDPTNSDPL